MSIFFTAWILFHSVKALELCTTDFCPPSSLTPKIELYTADLINFVLEDPKSGCTCREAPGKVVCCFGRNQNCKFVPEKLNITTPSFRLKATMIEKLVTGAFDNFSNLSKVEILDNYHLTEILDGVFRKLFRVTKISIVHNPMLKVLNLKSFEGLDNLKELILIKNGFTKVVQITQALSSSIVPKLYSLVLNENYFKNIDQEDFVNTKNLSLKELDLDTCGIQYIHPKSLTNLVNLTVLRIGSNHLNTSTIHNLLEHTFSKSINLKYLDLHHSSLNEISSKMLFKLISKSSITSLTLSQNEFDLIDNFTFPTMPNVKILILSHTFTQQITQNSFQFFPSLQTLVLSKNRLTSLPKNVFLPKLTYLDLQKNNDGYGSTFLLSKEQFLNMRKLQFLSLESTALLNLQNNVFSNLKLLRILNLRNCSIYRIESGIFRPLNNLKTLDLQYNNLAKANGTLGSYVLDGLSNLETLLLGYNDFSYFESGKNNPFRFLTNLKHLGLENNMLTSLGYDNYGCMKNLESINVSHNILTSWDDQIFANNTKLKILNASKNKFSYLSSNMMADFVNLDFLNLQNNPFTCDCQVMNKFVESYISQNFNLVALLNDNPIKCIYPAASTNWTLSDILKNIDKVKKTCATKFKYVYLIPLLVFIGFFAFLAILLYVYRWHIKYWIFLSKLYLNRTGKKKFKVKQNLNNYVYDAFVSYSNEDQNFVARLVTMLENSDPFFKLCVYERDFIIGSVISESVLENISKSKKTLLVVSNSYAKSYWCTWESHIAEHHRLFFENPQNQDIDDTIVLIKLGPINENILTPTLKYLLKTRIYLQWEADLEKQKTFWKKLKTALCPPLHTYQKSDNNVLEKTSL